MIHRFLSLADLEKLRGQEHPEPLLAEQFAADDAMANVGLRAVAVDRRRIAAEDADVVEHGGLLQELYIDRQFAVFPDDGQTAVCHLSGVEQ